MQKFVLSIAALFAIGFCASDAFAQTPTPFPTRTPIDRDGFMATHSCHDGNPGTLAVGESVTCQVRVRNYEEETSLVASSFVFNRKGVGVPSTKQEITTIRIYDASGARLSASDEAAAISGTTATIPPNGYAVYETTFTRENAAQWIMSNNRYACATVNGSPVIASCTQLNNS